ncbi:MAG: lipid asymmetry maintenance ABC transporter permease subunit MlaE [Sinimarinibacterium flocculans]|uniref:Intermembrane phospholipid transport system permease protein MlaE n=1 Tax=Sinimarinibacterium flocculans TaxID=985250 RepID=A0A318EHR0_9GAMM|nr:lipid asymmetry maintenance ABC transporter permease subunit MlaE [Sinimarinibacterium flocculans]MEC9364715.1 lipid asymmetry maintenance ABC transporter permease subunit MlaE [Pseudomonadota bacterium]PXV70345.1 phospholipid/cholesterol/gamma-HCH transport system permease protein [Sinimarinibacterium flocculans]
MNGIWQVLSAFLAGLGRAQFFLLSMLAAVPAALLRPRLLVQQIYSVGVLSLIIIVLSGSFVGMVLALQGFRTLIRFGAEESLGVFVALVIVRELGPVVTALLFAGRAGSALAAEIGLMRATDQLSAMEMMAVDPMRHVIAPRFVAGLIAMPLLSGIFCVMAIGVAGGHAIGVELLGVDSGSYWSQIRSSVEVTDIVQSFFKALVFGAAISWIAVYQGYHAAPTSEGVSRATTSTVVVSSLSILALDFILTAFMFG